MVGLGRLKRKKDWNQKRPNTLENFGIKHKSLQIYYNKPTLVDKPRFSLLAGVILKQKFIV